MNIQLLFLTRLILSALVLSGAFSPLDAATVVWDGGGKDPALWSGSGTKGNNNWNGNTAPVNGDALQFAGTLKLISTNNIDNLSVISVTFNSGAGAFCLYGNYLTLAGNITNNSNNLQTINLSLGLSAADRTFATTSGDIAVNGVISGGFGIVKADTHDLFLTGANTYTGNTSIIAGSLFANNILGSATGMGAVNVGADGTLGGTGTIAPTGSYGITVSGTIAPGDGSAPANLSIDLSSTSGKLFMGSGAEFQFHLSVIGIGDMLSIVGSTAGDVVFNNNMINFMGTGMLGSYKIFDTDTNQANTWTGLTVNESGQITNGLSYSNLSNGNTAVFYVGGGSYGGDPGDIYVQVIPEPSAALLGGLGVGLLLMRRRRVDKKS